MPVQSNRHLHSTPVHRSAMCVTSVVMQTLGATNTLQRKGNVQLRNCLANTRCTVSTQSSMRQPWLCAGGVWLLRFCCIISKTTLSADLWCGRSVTEGALLSNLDSCVSPDVISASTLVTTWLCVPSALPPVVLSCTVTHPPRQLLDQPPKGHLHLPAASERVTWVLPLLYHHLCKPLS